MKNNIVNLSHISYLRKFSDRKIHSSPVTPFFHVISINTNLILLVSYFSKDNAIPFIFLFATISTVMVFHLVVQNIIIFSYNSLFKRCGREQKTSIGTSMNGGGWACASVHVVVVVLCIGIVPVYGMLWSLSAIQTFYLKCIK